ncbi:DUF262 domain-containing protein [Aeromonas veronii]
MSSAVTPKPVQSVFDMYQKDALIVNRRYQRKLVWSLDEKEKFIDSLLKGYPIPLILTSRHKHNESGLEILDGLQRLNAITSFIECDYSVNGLYFDLNSITMTKQLKESGELTQKEPIMSSEDCSKVLNYEIPFSTTLYNDDEFIDETFRRINTGGRRLSRHDVRQAGSVGVIPETINNIAIYIRQDSSRTDTVTLKNMKKISIGDARLNYGINIDSMFWVRQNIITKENIKCSRDEELISFILSHILLPEKSNTTSRYLDEIYNSDSAESKALVSEIDKVTSESLIKSITYVFDELSKIFKDDRTNFTDTIYKTTKRNIANSFQIIFISLYEEVVYAGKKINNYKNLHESLIGCFDKHFAAILNGDRKWSNTERRELIQVAKAIISPHLSTSKNKPFEAGGWIKNLENIINESRTEQQYYDFKAGLVTTSPLDNKINLNLVSKIVKTLVAMTNSHKGECMIIVGVAESEEGAKNHKNAYGKSYIKYADRFIVGINDEANHVSGNLDLYLKKIKDHVQKEPISDRMKTEILMKIINFNYKDKEILVFRSQRAKNPEVYDGCYYNRYLSHNNKIDIGSEEMNILFQDFNK